MVGVVVVVVAAAAASGAGAGAVTCEPVVFWLLSAAAVVAPATKARAAPAVMTPSTTQFLPAL